MTTTKGVPVTTSRKRQSRPYKVSSATAVPGLGLVSMTMPTRDAAIAQAQALAAEHGVDFPVAKPGSAFATRVDAHGVIRTPRVGERVDIVAVDGTLLEPTGKAHRVLSVKGQAALVERTERGRVVGQLAVPLGRLR